MGNSRKSTVDDRHGLGVADEQQSVFPQRKMEDGENFRLRLRPQVDREVSTRNEIEARKWRFRQHVLHREHDACAQFGSDPEAVILLGKEPRQSFWRNLGLDGLRVEAVASERNRIGINIAGEYL